MTAQSASAPGGGVVAKMGIAAGSVVQELGYDDDCDEALRAAIAEAAATALVDEDYEDVVDVVLLWFRDGDDDLGDLLVDVIGPLADHGVVWLLTPKPGRPGHVEPEDITDAAPTVGLAATSSVSAATDWQGTRLVAPRSGSSRR